MNFEDLAKGAANNAADAASDLRTAAAGGLPCERHALLVLATARLGTALASAVAAQAALNSRDTGEVLEKLRRRLASLETSQATADIASTKQATALKDVDRRVDKWADNQDVRIRDKEAMWADLDGRITKLEEPDVEGGSLLE